MQRDIVIVVGNPKENSRTRQAAEKLADLLTDGAPHTVIELTQLGEALLGTGAPAVKQAKDTVANADLVIVASPTFKATYTGLLKLFLDQFAGETGLEGVTAIPLMLGAGQQHALAVRHTLSPVLTELGALVLPGLFLNDATFGEDGTIDTYVRRWKGSVDRLTVG